MYTYSIYCLDCIIAYIKQFNAVGKKIIYMRVIKRNKLMWHFILFIFMLTLGNFILFLIQVQRQKEDFRERLSNLQSEFAESQQTIIKLEGQLEVKQKAAEHLAMVSVLLVSSFNLNF